MATDSWRQHFSSNAGDLIAIHRWICGPEIAQKIIMACFKRRLSSGRINETTVCRVLSELDIWITESGACETKGAI